ncbi:MAG: folylpolyglutamate synthase/dihydrofolate synthase family protein [Candidatus Omnitrophota bacterium]|nr:bifunctional folylpolyglutamate synthase/dihydrofolate synthase [Candidatus Omnitrophota bacterium]
MSGYRKAVEYLGSFVNYERVNRYPYKKAFSLNRMKDFLRIIGNPQEGLKIIHVAGSKGKGSVCAFTAYVLRQAGFSVGLYTSPHLSDFRERIRILRPFSANTGLPFEGAISRDSLARLTAFLKPAIEKFGQLSFFEVYTALAFLHFRSKGVDFAVMETGMGGRLDATNAAASLVCGITPLSYEHTRYLGNTLAMIAREKSGIIKKHALVISARQPEEAARVIRRKCAIMRARLFTVGREIKCFARGDRFSVQGARGYYPGLKIKLLGSHQISNACQAVGIVEALGEHGFEVSVDCLKKGLYNTLWPGRIEVLRRNPYIVLDGAQNAASVSALKTALRDNFKYKRIILVFGSSQDKDIKGMARELSSLGADIVLTCADTPRAAEPVQLKGYFASKGKNAVDVTRSVKEAFFTALHKARAEDLVLVTGSLFVVGEFRDVYRKYS